MNGISSEIKNTAVKYVLNKMFSSIDKSAILFSKLNFVLQVVENDYQ